MGWLMGAAGEGAAAEGAGAAVAENAATDAAASNVASNAAANNLSMGSTGVDSSRYSAFGPNDSLSKSGDMSKSMRASPDPDQFGVKDFAKEARGYAPGSGNQRPVTTANYKPMQTNQGDMQQPTRYGELMEYLKNKGR